MSEMRGERLAWLVAGLILLALPLAVLLYTSGPGPQPGGVRVIDIRTAAPENGGFSPSSLRVDAGETVRLRFHGADVVHGVAIGPATGIDVGEVDPGHVEEVTVTFDEPGTYTFYCTTWCSDDHWRMRGVIEVGDVGSAAAEVDPVIEALIAEGVDIDATHSPDEHDPAFDGQPSAAGGAEAVEALVMPSELRDADWRFTHTPADGLAALRAANPDQPEELLADAAAHLWVGEVAPETVERYDENCAACHGQWGAGDGPAADTTAEEPTAFADPAYMFERRGDVLYAKIRRGGMGTDMPNFGTVFTQEETRALVDYLWALAFDPPEG